jgi:transposase
VGQRKLVPYENPQRRRLNTLAALDKGGPAPGLYWVNKPKAFVAEEFVRFLLALPQVPVPRVVVIDNGPIHRNSVVKAAMPQLWARRIYLYYIPPYSPELNDIEPVFRNTKHYELPERRYTSVPDLESAVDRAFTRTDNRIVAKCLHQPRLAA